MKVGNPYKKWSENDSVGALWFFSEIKYKNQGLLFLAFHSRLNFADECFSLLQESVHTEQPTKTHAHNAVCNLTCNCSWQLCSPSSKETIWPVLPCASPSNVRSLSLALMK